MSNAVLQVIIMIIVILYCAYMLYSSLRLYKKDKSGAAEYLTVHPDAKRESYSLWQAWMLVGMAVLCFVLVFFGQLITPEGQQVWIYQLTYVALGLVFLGLSLDVWLHRRLILSSDGFFYAGEIFRFRAILGMDQKRGIFKNVKLHLANGQELEMTNRVGMAVREEWLSWKEKKKEKRKEPQKPLKTLLLCDVDGTLLVNDRIRPEDAAALQRWKQAGNRFGLLTGRGKPSAGSSAADWGVNPDVLITDNGAQVMLGGECVYRQWLRSSQVKAVLDKLQDAGLWPGLCVPFVTMPDGAHRFCRRRMPVAAMERMMEVQAHLTYFSEQDLEDLLAESPSVPGLSLYVWDERNTAGVLEQARALAPEMQWHQTSHDYVEACESDKALALRALLSQMPEIPVCFAGDGPNDVPVFDMLEDAWCMDTAPDPVKAHACYVTESVAQVIERKLDYVEET